MIKKVVFYKNIFFDIWIKDFNVMINVFDLKYCVIIVKGVRILIRRESFWIYYLF